ncbi:MAG: outer membrane lipoprotein-sorting protein [Flavobacteriaceae bacterium]|nr:outer membrane lipoprotein-sorting protein [Flavobacteriaceae bacterium]
MKTIKTLIIAFLIIAITPATAQTADEIINNYFENTGGAANWAKLNGVKMEAEANAQGMVIPVEIYQTKDGKQLVSIDLQGQKMTQVSFDGETMWTTNFMTMAAEKSDQETTDNMKKQMKDFPSPLLNYKEKGYSVELLENETIEGADTFKIKLTQDLIMVDGVETANITYFYFEKENFVPIVSESKIQQGPMKGQMNKTTLSDYEEVDGLYFPFSMNMGGQAITIKKIILNPEIDMAMFAFPEVAIPTEEGKK